MTCSTSGAVLIKTTTPPCLFWSFSSSQLRKKKKKGRRAARTRLWHRIPALIHPPTMRTVNASSSNTSPDLGAEKMPVGLAVEASKSLGVAYSEAKLERRGGWRIWMEVRRSEEEEEEGRWSGGWGWESKRGRKKREREAKEIYRAKKEKHVFTVAAAASRCRSSSFVFTPSCGVTPVQSLKKAAGWKQDLIQRRRRMKYIYI